MPQMPGLMPIVMVSQPPIATGGASTSIHRVGYQRVSSLEQNLARQLDGIVLDQTCPDRLLGTDVDRPQPTEVLPFVRARTAPVGAAAARGACWPGVVTASRQWTGRFFHGSAGAPSRPQCEPPSPGPGGAIRTPPRHAKARRDGYWL